MDPEGAVIPFADGHTRQLPVITAGPFRYATYADSYLAKAKEIATRPVKQAVIAPSALSLLYPGDGISSYPKEAFIEDLVNESETDIRRSLDGGRFDRSARFHRRAVVSQSWIRRKGCRRRLST